MKKFLCILIMIVILLFPSNIYAKSVNNERNYANVVFFTYFNEANFSFLFSKKMILYTIIILGYPL